MGTSSSIPKGGGRSQSNFPNGELNDLDKGALIASILALALYHIWTYSSICLYHNSNIQLSRNLSNSVYWIHKHRMYKDAPSVTLASEYIHIYICMYIYIYIHIYTYTYIYIYIYIYEYKSICIYKHLCKCIYVYINMYFHWYIYMNILNAFTNMCMFMCMYTYF
jgi:hypothetical protein